MEKFKVTLTERNVFDLWLFIFVRNAVRPKDRAETRILRNVCNAFGVTKMRKFAEDLPEGKSFARNECSNDPVVYEASLVELDSLLEYLDDMTQADPALADRLLDVSMELERAKFESNKA